MQLSSRFTLTLLTVFAVIGFYLAALGLAVGLILLGLSPFLFDWSVPVIFVLWSLIGGAVVLWSVLPRWDSFEPPSPRLDPSNHPRLFDKLFEVARATEQKMPREVYLINAMNAAVLERGGILGIGSRRVMYLGLPALRILSVSELQAILAHEFGHFYGGDTKLGPWVYKTRSAIGRTSQNLPKRNLLVLLWLLFEWCGKGFMRLTLWVSRQQEHSADELAARTYGAQPIARALCKINGLESLHLIFWGNDMIPAIQRGYVPPWSEGFGSFITTLGIPDTFSILLQSLVQDEEPKEFDTHPLLRDRLASLGQPQSLQISFDDVPATSLLDGLRDLEVRLATFTQSILPKDGLQQISWEEVGTKVYVPRWLERRDRFQEVWAGLRIFSLVETVSQSELVDFGKRFLPPRELPPPGDLSERGIGAIAAVLSIALFDQGWGVQALPGAEIKLIKDHKSLEPFTLAREIAQGKISPESWRQQCTELGIADATLAPSNSKLDDNVASPLGDTSKSDGGTS